MCSKRWVFSLLALDVLQLQQNQHWGCSQCQGPEVLHRLVSSSLKAPAYPFPPTLCYVPCVCVLPPSSLPPSLPPLSLPPPSLPPPSPPLPLLLPSSLPPSLLPPSLPPSSLLPPSLSPSYLPLSLLPPSLPPSLLPSSSWDGGMWRLCGDLRGTV